VSGYLVGSAAFKAVVTSDPREAGSIPVHLRHQHKKPLTSTNRSGALLIPEIYDRAKTLSKPLGWNTSTGRKWSWTCHSEVFPNQGQFSEAILNSRMRSYDFDLKVAV
jgi:hypothetical protein